VGDSDPAQSAGKFFLVVPPVFGSKSTIRRFGERFRDGQYSLVGLLFAVLLLTVLPRAQPFVKVGGTCPRAPWSRRHCPTLTVHLHCHSDGKNSIRIVSAVESTPLESPNNVITGDIFCLPVAAHLFSFVNV